MATLESIQYVPHRAEVHDSSVVWEEARRRNILDLPQIVWADQTPWREANLWALSRASVKRTSLKTIWSGMKHLHAYAKWIEQVSIDWWHFPAKEADRCLVRFRGDLIASIDRGEIAPSTAQQRMAATIRFYRWLSATRLISPENPMWQEKVVGIRLQDPFGFERTIVTNSTDLAIKNLKAPSDVLEDGLLPVPSSSVSSILNFAEKHASTELNIMLRLGFNTGMRSGTIGDLKVQTIQRAVESPIFPGFNLISVGPGARPKVHTKYGVTGEVLISSRDLDMLRHYIFSVRRLKRQTLADPQHRDLIFLTRFGTRYGTEGSDSSRAINVELGRLRKAGQRIGIVALHNFHFHQSRCTFATELARLALRHGGVSFALGIVKQALLHKREDSTLRYIRFVEKTKIMAEISDEFTNLFLGMILVEGNQSE
ncbi:tyrosine-type recombinase/integrase [Pseudomonas sp. NPDC077382]